MASNMNLLVRMCCTWVLILTAVNGDYCNGYYDSYGSYNYGFSCPTWADWNDEYYCCGTSTWKYCCDYSTWLYSGYDSDDDFNWGSDYDGYETAVGVGVSVIIGSVFGVIGLIVLLVVSIVICVCCCAKSSGGTRTTTTHVVQAPAVQPTVVSYSAHAPQGQMGYNTSPPGYNAYPSQPPQYPHKIDDPVYPPDQNTTNPYA
ncbi:uncharacterized protein LOC144453347 [Glandiceps talaboti]